MRALYFGLTVVEWIQMGCLLIVFVVGFASGHAIGRSR